MTEVDVRQARAGDTDALAAAYRSAYRENRRLGFPAKAESVRADTVAEWIRDHLVFVAIVSDDVVGGVRLAETDTDCAKLSRLGVHGNWKRHGIGSQLLERAESAARQRGCTAVRLTTPGDHPHLPEFYRQRGYEQTGEYPLDYRDYDEIVMEKRLE